MPHKEMCATAEGQTHLVLAGLQGGGECRRAAGPPASVLVMDTQPFSCFPAPPGLLGCMDIFH